MNSSIKKLVLAYIAAVNKYADLCKIVEDLPSKQLETLMQAESLIVMGQKVLKWLENENENN